MHVVGLRGIQVQLDNSWAITAGLCVLQQHQCPNDAAAFGIQERTRALS